MRKGERSVVTTKRKAEIKTFIINNPGEWISTKKLSEKYNVSTTTIRNDVKEICESIPGTLHTAHGVKGVPNSGGFKFVPADIVVKDELEDKYKSPWLNQEGYSDPTAKLALEKVADEVVNRRNVAKWDAGAVWDTTAGTKSHELVLVLRADTFKSNVLPLFEKDAYKIDGNEEYTRIIKYGKYVYYTDIRCVKAKPNKYFLEEQFTIELEDLEQILMDVSRLFSVNTSIQNRVNVLEMQADKYRIMINDLRAEVEKLTGENKKLTSIISDLEERDQNHCDEMSIVLSEQSNAYLSNNLEAYENHIRELQEKNEELVNAIAEQENEIKSLRKAEPVEVTNIERALLNQRLQIYEAFLKSFGVTF